MIPLLLIFGAVAVIGTGAAMSLRRPVHCVLALAVGLIGIAAVYLALGAQFVGFTQIMVYVGAVAILAVFAIMTTQESAEQPGSKDDARVTWKAVSGVATAAGVLAVLVRVIATGGFALSASHSVPNPTVSKIGVELMGGFAWPLEVVGLLLTSAMVGAVIVAMPDKRRRP